MVLANKHRGRELEPLPKHEELLKGQATLDDDTETEIFDVGQLSSQTVEIILSGYLDLVLNDQGNVDFRLYVDVNGSLTQVGGTQNMSGDGGLDLENFNIGQPVASSRVRVTAQGNTASPTTGATVDYSVEHQTAT